jgi:hypothetical protein
MAVDIGLLAEELGILELRRKFGVAGSVHGASGEIR